MSVNFVDASKVNVDDSLGQSSAYTIGDVLRLCQEHNRDFVEARGESRVVGFSARDISQDKGYCSRVFKTRIEFEDESRPAYTFVIKVPTTDNWNEMGVEFTAEEKAKNKVTLQKMHNTECNAYEMLRDIKPDFPIPRIHYFERMTDSRPGMIMMDDLSGRGAALGIFYSVTEGQCFNLAKHMVDLQVHVDFMADKTWPHRFTDNIHATPVINDTWKKVMEPVVDYEDKELVDKIRVYLDLDFMKLGAFTLEEMPGKYGCSTLVHGDMWANNMLIALSEDASVSDRILAIIDWQIAFFGSPLFDIARFLTNSADADVRRSCERRVVDHYYDYLTERYAEHEGAKPRMTREQAHELYALALSQLAGIECIMFTVMAFPLRDSKDGAEQARLKKLALRLSLLLDDAFPVLDKYKMRTRFKHVIG